MGIAPPSVKPNVSRILIDFKGGNQEMFKFFDLYAGSIEIIEAHESPRVPRVHAVD
jgi:hypothetical protein